MASIYNLLENKNATPLSIVNSKVTLLEHITLKSIKESTKKSKQLKKYLQDILKKLKIKQ